MLKNVTLNSPKPNKALQGTRTSSVFVVVSGVLRLKCEVVGLTMAPPNLGVRS